MPPRLPLACGCASRYRTPEHFARQDEENSAFILDNPAPGRITARGLPTKVPAPSPHRLDGGHGVPIPYVRYLSLPRRWHLEKRVRGSMVSAASATLLLPLLVAYVAPLRCRAARLVGVTAKRSMISSLPLPFLL